MNLINEMKRNSGVELNEVLKAPVNNNKAKKDLLKKIQEIKKDIMILNNHEFSLDKHGDSKKLGELLYSIKKSESILKNINNINEAMDQDGGGGHYDDGEQAGSEKRTEKKLKPFKNLKINGKKIGSENNILTIDGKKFGEIIYEEPAKIWYVSGNKYPETSKTFNGLVKKLMGLTFKKKGK